VHSIDSDELDSLLHQARLGVGTLDVTTEVASATLTSLERWLSDRTFRSYGAQIRALIEHSRWSVIVDSFYRVLPFGTGGRRGCVGVGPNRFNPYTLGASVQGHATFLRRRLGEGAFTVVVACDVRCFHNLRGQLVDDVPNPVLGLSSRDFAHIAAEVYAAAGFTVVLPPEGEALSTPELSFAIRALGAVGGLQVSASHNHPDDNGGKLYTATGGQEVPPRDQEVADEVARVAYVDRMSLDRARSAGLVKTLSDDVVDAYQRAVLASGCDPDARAGRIVFTALHGTGRRTAYAILRRAGFDVELEPTQAEPDGRFPAVPFLAPNPEVPASMRAAVAFADQRGADLVMSCDPDADRIGLMVRERAVGPGATDPVRWRFVTGNEIAALVVHQALRGRSTDGPAPLVIQTQVTSGLVRRVAELHGARVVDDLLVGFKYIGEAMDQMAETGTVRGFEAAPLESFAAGVEESHGVLVTPQMRDKDAAGGALLLAELAAHERRRGRTLVDTLDDLQRQTGGVANLLVSAVLQGARGRQTIEQIQDSLRTHPPATIGGYAVERFFDRRDPSGPLGPIRSQTDASSRDVLVFELVNDARVVVRPSGTEPKLKVYVQVAGRVTAPRSVSELDQAVRRLADDFVLFALERGGLSLPHWALRIHGLVNTEDKIWFAQTLLPELIERIERGDEPAARERWVDIQLTRFGADARGLFVPGLAAWSRISTQPHVMAVLAHFRK
jgi:phosphoglucomutase/phosphomannomutase